MDRLVVCGLWRHGAVESLVHVETHLCVDAHDVSSVPLTLREELARLQERFGALQPETKP
jgi:hypothetical protein